MVSVVTDSTADLPDDVASKLGIRVIPLYVRFGDQVLKDHIEISPEDFLNRLEASSVLPRTSQPSPSDFIGVYEEMVSAGVTDIISIHISSTLSGTYSCACLAREAVMEKHRVNIEVIDGVSASMGTGLLAIESARMANEGATVSEITERINFLKNRLKIFLAVDTLEYLAKNGRIGKAQELLGTLLSIKPILGLKDGEVIVVSKVRGRSRVVSEIVQAFIEHIPPGASVLAAVAHANNPAMAENLAQRLQETYEVQGDLIVTYAGPVIASHTGPGLVGAVVVEI